MKNSAITFLLYTAIRFPNKICLKDDVEELSFKELLYRAYCIGKEINKKGKVNQPIIIYLPKAATAVVSFAAVLMSGNFYVPLDIKSPKNRIRLIFDNIQPHLIISTREYQKDLEELSIPIDRTIFLNDLQLPISSEISISHIVNEIKENISGIIDTDPIYIMHTSGSTGIPKGVVISHRGVLDYIEWAVSCLHVDENYIIGNQAPFFFDNSTLDIYLSWSTGAQLYIIPEKAFLFPSTLLEHLERNGISFIFFVPSVLGNIAKMRLLSSGRLPNLKKVIFAGEVMPAKHLAYWQRNLPRPLYVNLYGPTEITVDCTYFVVDRIYEDNESIPIGFPCHNSGILILNQDDHPAKVYEKGELCVRGSSLALGYWNDEESTKKVFIQNPTNKKFTDLIYRTGDLVYKDEKGCIYFVGRKDFQIKHMGNRIELGEIETAIMNIPSINNCCVFYDNKKSEIIACYECEKQIDSGMLRQKCSKILPGYMIPKKFVHFDLLPINPSGKVDRKRLIENLN